MSDVPTEVTREILLRLPGESLIRFRAVCKAWRRMIDDPRFVKSHASTQLSSTTLLLRNSIGTRLYTLSWDSLDYADGCQSIDVTPVKTLIRLHVPRLPTLPVASSDGLILISHVDPNKVWAIWNPLTREFHVLPEPDAELRLIGSGLGYDSATDDYKAVRIDEAFSGHRKIVYTTLVYSLKSDSWRMIKNCPCSFAYGSVGVFVNGALHWRSWDYIIVLDLTTEVYQQLPLPPGNSDSYLDVHLNVLDGFLAFSHSCEADGFVVWVMKEKRVWTKLFSLRDLGYIESVFMLNPQPVAYWESKGQILFQNEDRFIWWDLVDRSAKKVTMYEILHGCFYSQVFPGSLVRLGNRVAPAKTTVGTKRKRKRKITSMRLKISATVCDAWCRSDTEYESDYDDFSEGEDHQY